MAKVFGPCVHLGHPERDVDCRESLRLAFLDLIDQAEDAGWSVDEVAQSLVSLSEEHKRLLDELTCLLQDEMARAQLTRKAH